MSDRFPGTVVIPAYNVEQFVGQAFESIAQQSYLPEEAIVVDDGSSDATADRARELAAKMPFPVTVIRQPNGGISAARNTAITAARTDLIALLDADDLWLPRHLENIARALARQPDSVAVYCDAVHFDSATGHSSGPLSRGKTLAIAQPAGEALYRLERDVFLSLVPGLYMSPSAACFRKVINGETMLFEQDLGTSEDRYMFMRLAKLGTITFVDEVSARIRRHDTNTTHARNALWLGLNGVKALKKTLHDADRLKLDSGERAAVKDALAVSIDNCLYHASRGGLGQYQQALETCQCIALPPAPMRVIHWLRAIACSLRAPRRSH